MFKHVPLNHLVLRRRYLSPAILCFLIAPIALCSCLSFAQTSPPTRTTAPSASQAKDSAGQPDDPQDYDVPIVTHTVEATPEQKLDDAWSMLNAAVVSKHVDLRIQALAALGTLGINPVGIKRIAAAMNDKDLDVRTAAILAAGETNDRNLTGNLRAMLDDKEPQVAFAAALTLWKMKDRSGEDILVAVVDGDRSANPTMANSTRQNLNRSLRHPAGLARLAGMQGAAMLLGPFGFGITAYEYMHKNGGDAGRVTAIEQLSQQKNGSIRLTLIAALGDKDVAVRAAAAKALGSYHERAASDALFPLFLDPKTPVRFTAAAAYINSTLPIPVEKRSQSLGRRQQAAPK